jgi:hypothetical protein
MNPSNLISFRIYHSKWGDRILENSDPGALQIVGCKKSGWRMSREAEVRDTGVAWYSLLALLI